VERGEEIGDRKEEIGDRGEGKDRGQMTDDRGNRK